ncbi:MAG: polysaccharide pyruvyl transferase family protein [Lachnospiraceae bacterium]|nr:polysaccharide pyruvyl transferase family protein [Lachnospiraceae bacterium]
MKQKVGIITFHAAWNYGAILQCTALYRKLESMGCEVQVIDYQPADRVERLVRNPIRESVALFRDLEGRKCAYKLFRATLRFVRCILDLKKVTGISRKKRGFEDFRNKYLSMTCRYASLGELQENPPDFDAYFCGSDQLWNASLTGGIYDPAYFLAFGKPNVKRAAYAVSACNIQNKDDVTLTNLLGNIDYLSLREKKNQKIIEKQSGKEVCICPDPTLLLSADEYLKMEKTVKIEEPYVFVYLLSKENAVEPGKALVKLLKNICHLSVIDASPNRFLGRKGITAMPNLFPGEWLYLIHHAEYVITNSFHCTVLSSIYKKQCVVLPCHESNMERLEEFMENAGLKERILYTGEEAESVLGNTIEYTRMMHYQEKAQVTADAYLKKCLSGSTK